jgi:hypothetical protein
MRLPIRIAEKAECNMLSIAIVPFIIVFPILIPVGVESFCATNDAHKRRRNRSTHSAIASAAQR